MTREEFQKKFGNEYAQFLATPCGQAMVQALSGLIPPYEHPKEPHLYADNRGKRAGYEICLRTMLSLPIPTIQRREVEPNYGIADPTTK